MRLDGLGLGRIAMRKAQVFIKKFKGVSWWRSMEKSRINQHRVCHHNSGYTYSLVMKVAKRPRLGVRKEE